MSLRHRFIPLNFTKCFKIPTVFFFSIAHPTKAYPRPSKIVLGSEQFCILIFAEFSTFLLFSSTFPWVQMKNVYVFPDVCKDFWRKNVISWSFLNQNFYNVKQSLYLQLQCYMTIIFKNFDYNCCFNSESFSWNKIQHKT